MRGENHCNTQSEKYVKYKRDVSEGKELKQKDSLGLSWIFQSYNQRVSPAKLLSQQGKYKKKN